MIKTVKAYAIHARHANCINKLQSKHTESIPHKIQTNCWVFDLLLDPEKDLVQRVTLKYLLKGDVRGSQIDIFLEEDAIDNVEGVLDAWATSASWALMPQSSKT